MLALAVAVIAAGCGVLGESREDRIAREAREAQMVREAIANQEFTIDVDQMLPARGPSKMLSTPYSLTVKDGKIGSYLPYFGQAWNVPYGGGHALNFDAEIGSYSSQETKPGVYDVNIFVRTDEDEHLYTLRIFDNGRTSIEVRSRNRDRISFMGQMRFDDEQ